MEEPNENSNRYLNWCNKRNAEIKNEKTYYVRTGRCTPDVCQSACCRFTCSMESGEFACNMKDFDWIHEIGDVRIFVKNKYCRYLTILGKCKIHNTSKQPRVCKFFPMHPTDDQYKVVRDFCGFKFTEAVNKKYNFDKI